MITRAPLYARRRGLILADAVAGMAIVAVLAVSLTMLLGRYRDATRRLADTRQAVAVAERVLSSLQAGQAPSPEAEGEQILLRPLDIETTPERLRWVRVTVTRREQQAEVIGLVPARTLEASR